MAFRKAARVAARRPEPLRASVPDALRAARRALDQQTARVTELEAQIRLLSVRGEPAPDPARVVLADTEIYWRGNRLLR